MTVPAPIERSFDRIVARLQGVHLSGPGQAVAVCPVCRNGSPNRKHNLSVTYFPESGETKTNCFSAECTRATVLAALDLPPSAAYDNGPQKCEKCDKLTIPNAEGRYIHDWHDNPRPARSARQRPPAATARPVASIKLPALIAEPAEAKFKVVVRYHEVAAWEHIDLHGELKARSVRKERELLYEGAAEPVVDKMVRPQYFDPANGGRWCRTKAESPVTSVPIWRLPEVRAAVAAGEVVWGAEGHKAAESLVQHGECATTVLLGAFDSSAAEGLAGADFRYVCDQDATGYTKGLKAVQACAGVAARVTLWLPAVDGPGDDAYDHFAAGHGVEDFIQVDVAQVESLLALASARGDGSSNGRLQDPRRIEREARAWMARAAAADERGDAETAGIARANAELWVRSGEQRLRRVLKHSAALHALQVASEAQFAEMEQLVTAAASFAFGLAEECGIEADPDLVNSFSSEHSRPVRTGEHGPADDGPGAEIIEHPTYRRLPDPAHPFAMSRGLWAYEEGGPGRRARGVYLDAERVAPLPYVHARIVARDGQGRPTGTFYLLSATPDSEVIMVGYDQIRSNEWATMIQLTIPQDDKILRGAATAMMLLAETVELAEAVPRLRNGQITPARPETMPAGYLQQADMDRSAALGVWARIARLAAKNPKAALVVGASAMAPFVSGLKQQPHVVNLYGDPLRGKTTLFRLCAAMWGDPGGGESGNVGVLLNWNATSLAVPGLLGDLGVLPCFLDEVGQAGAMKDSQWHQLISNIAQGAFRLTRNRNRPGSQVSLPWRGIFFSNGNAPMAPEASGRNAGVPRRMVELSTPFTNDAEHAEAIDALSPAAFGHLGLEILDKVSVERLQPLIDQASATLGIDTLDSDHRKAIGKHLACHVAGAMLVDEICGTGQALYFAALQAAADHLDDCAAPLHDAERAEQELRDWRAREPSAWPTSEHYQLLHEPRPSSQLPDPLPAHGYRGPYAGVIMPDGEMQVNREAWKQLVARLELDSKVALRGMYDRGWLRVQDSRRRKGEWVSRSRVLDTDVYAITLPAPEDDEDDVDEILPDAPPPVPTRMNAPKQDEFVPVGGSEPPTLGVVGGGVGGTPTAVTTGVGGVGGVGGARARDVYDTRTREGRPDLDSAENPEMEEDFVPTMWLDRGGYEGWTTFVRPPRPCVICGKPSPIEMDSMPIHPAPCWRDSTRQERADMLMQRSVDDGWVSVPKPWPACVICNEPTSQALAGVPLHRGEHELEFLSRGKPVAPPPAAPNQQAKKLPMEGPRFLADSAVLDVGGAWLSTGAATTGPAQVHHVGDIATWALENRLGYGGTRHHLPEPGHVWLSRQLCAKLGLPTGPFKTSDEADAELTAMRALPLFTEAEKAGWEFSPDLTQPWLRMRAAGRTVIITGLGWGAGRYDELLHGDPTPEALAKRLGHVCRLIGYPYTLTPAVTGVSSLAYSTQHGLPPVAVPNVMFNEAGANPSWINLDAVQVLLADHPDWWAHMYDRRASYPASAGSAILGTGPATHHPDGVVFDKASAGLYRIAELVEQPLPQLAGFDLRNPLGYDQVNGWVSRAAVQFLIEKGIEPEILEAYVWEPAESGAQLKGWQAAVRDARASLAEAVRAGNPEAIAISDSKLYKDMTTGGIGRLASQQGREDPLQAAWRYYPHWRAEIVGTHTVNTLRAVARVANQSGGVFPVAIGDTDAIVYIGASADPGDVWPGQGADALSNPALGKFKPAASIQLGEWEQLMAAEQASKHPRELMQLIKAGRRW